MTHGYEYFDIEYEDIDLWDWAEDFLFDFDSFESELYTGFDELDDIYNEMAEESDEFDIYYQPIDPDLFDILDETESKDEDDEKL